MKYLLLVIIVLVNHMALAKPHIVTDITPIASLVAMLTKDSAIVTPLDIAAGCPHHHQAKPSDKIMLEKAAMVIYIDDDFDGVVASLLKDYKGRKIKISDFTLLDFLGMDKKINWHFWLDLNNVKVLLEELAKIIIATFPEMKEDIEQNLADSMQNINKLARIKQTLKLSSTALLSDSLEHFFKSIDEGQLKVLKVVNSSLKNIHELDKLLEEKSLKCIILAEDQNPNSYNKYNKIIIQLNSENWVLPENNNIANLFINEYNKMIQQASRCNR